jgi:hypothetical protein
MPAFHNCDLRRLNLAQCMLWPVSEYRYQGPSTSHTSSIYIASVSDYSCRELSTRLRDCYSYHGCAS